MHLLSLLWLFNLGINGPVVNTWQADAQCLLDQARNLLNVRESGGNNRGPVIDKIIVSSGGKLGQPWCGYFQRFIHLKCGRQAGNGYSPSWFIPTRLVKSNRVPGDVFSIYNSNLKRIAHIGMIEQILPNGKFVVTIEGNTGTSGIRDGAGVHRLTRPIKSIYNFARWWNLKKI
jgi:hypothetical protein